MKRVYIASSSRGSITELEKFAQLIIVGGHFVFVPMLGFRGVENLEVSEMSLAFDKGIPCATFLSGGSLPRVLWLEPSEVVFGVIAELRGWINEL